MKNKIQMAAAASIALSSAAFAVTTTTYDPDNSPTPVKYTPDNYVKVSAIAGYDTAYFDALGKKCFYFITDNASTNPDASYVITGGFSAVRTNSGTNEIFNLNTPTNTGGAVASMTIDDGVYNFAVSGLGESVPTVITSTVYASKNVSTVDRSIVYGANSTANVFAQSFGFAGGANTSHVIKGTFNIYNSPAPIDSMATKSSDVEIPANPVYGNTTATTALIIDGGTLNTSYMSGTGAITVKSGGTINAGSQALTLAGTGTFTSNAGSTITANNLVVASTGTYTINGTLNLTQASGSVHYPLEISSGRTLIFGEDADVFTTANSRIKLGANSVLAVYSGEKSIRTNLIFTDGVNATLELHGYNSFVGTDGTTFNTTLLGYAGRNMKLIVSDTNTFGATFAASMRFYVDLDFASADQYIDFGRVYSSGGQDFTLYVKDYEENRIKAETFGTGGAAIGGTNLYVFNDATSQYELAESQWVEALGGGYFLNLVPVPEPATYAALLGALALGFAAYRRRK